ncbi:hypothetical protein FRB95_000090 [Tulasnella sp. JGI-2019a]|nr:hypothetical protein FRB95_000090 [Tulasnella sp. JGI-2019a]
METPRMRPGMMPRFHQGAPTPAPEQQQLPYPFPNPFYFPIHPSYFPAAFYGQFGAYGPPLPLGEDGREQGQQPLAIEAGPSTSRALITLPKATQRDTPTSYPMPPCEDPDNPPSAIHPYLYNEDCPVVWDVRTNLMHSARRTSGERLSMVALKAQAINAGGLNVTTMRIVCADDNFPWMLVINKENGISVSDVLMEIAVMLDKEITEPEQWIARADKVERAEAARLENEGTGAIKTREKGDILRRVDWLGNKTRFRGLQHSSAKDYELLIQRRVHSADKPNTWVLLLEDRVEAVA